MNGYTSNKLFKKAACIHTIFIVSISAIFLACAQQASQIKIGGSQREMVDHYYKTKQYDKAKKGLLNILNEKPDDLESNFRLAVILGKEGLIDKSRSRFEKVLAINPEYSKAYYNLGVLYSNEKSEEYVNKSIKYFNVFLELEPKAERRQDIEKWIEIQIKNIEKRTKDKMK